MFWENVHEDTKDGFNIVLSFAPEDSPLEGCFEDADLSDILEGVESGRYIWFVARLCVYRHGVKLGTDYLGGCLYKSAEDFLNGGYYEDMVNLAINEAKDKLKLLRGA